MDACRNCKSTDWAAKNDEYCTDCERSWWQAFTQIISRKSNPLQAFADQLLAKYSQSKKGEG